MSLLCLSVLRTSPQSHAALAEELRNRAPLVIGHRGACAQAPENTLPSFRLALAAEADLVELDYHHSRDGVPMVLHDGTLDRTTNATNLWGGAKLAVSAKSVAEIATLDAGSWYDVRFSGVRDPTLVEAVQTIQASGTTLIERKGGDPRTLVTLLRTHGWMDRVMVQSFDWAFVKAAHAEAPELVLGALGPPSTRDGRKLEEAEKVLSAAYVEQVAALGARFAVWNRQVDAAGIQAARERGLGVWVYTINDPAEAEALVRLGVEGIITDDPARIRARLRPAPDEATETTLPRAIPSGLEDHPGNIFLEGDAVRVRLPEPLPPEADRWRLLDDRRQQQAAGSLPGRDSEITGSVEVGALGIGWYRLEVGTEQRPDLAWTTAAVLARLKAPTPPDSPVCVDSATSWFARGDAAKQRRFANLATLAGVNWVRDRLRWSEIQPAAGALTTNATTYDSAALAHHEAGLKVLQVFHDTPPWARGTGEGGGRFAPDLRHVYALGKALAERFRGQVQAWEPWNEANVASFGGHTVDQMCAWQKAAWLGFKAGDPSLIVGWNVTAAVPTPQHTTGVLANRTWPYYDTYNIHTYDWSHAYAALWEPARLAASERPLWITEADRGTRHLGQAPWFDQDPRLEQLKAEWIPQSYAQSLFAGARRHFHFILGHYHEPNGVQFGLLRLDLTPRPAYVALAAVGRWLAGARSLGRWQPAPDVHVYAFGARPDGVPHDVLVMWTEKEVDWDGRGQATSSWRLPNDLTIQRVVDHLGRTVELPARLGSAPLFVVLPAGQAATLPLEAPRRLAAAPGSAPASPLVLQVGLPAAATMRVEDVPWSEGYAYGLSQGTEHAVPIRLYNFSADAASVSLKASSLPGDWVLRIPSGPLDIPPQGSALTSVTLEIPKGTPTRDGWIALETSPGSHGSATLAFRIRVREAL